jgi:hypothetical protein
MNDPCKCGHDKTDHEHSNSGHLSYSPSNRTFLGFCMGHADCVCDEYREEDGVRE